MLECDWPGWYLTAWQTNRQTDYNTSLPLAGEVTTEHLQNTSRSHATQAATYVIIDICRILLMNRIFSCSDTNHFSKQLIDGVRVSSTGDTNTKYYISTNRLGTINVNSTVNCERSAAASRQDVGRERIHLTFAICLYYTPWRHTECMHVHILEVYYCKFG